MYTSITCRFRSPVVSDDVVKIPPVESSSPAAHLSLFRGIWSSNGDPRFENTSWKARRGSGF